MDIIYYTIVWVLTINIIQPLPRRKAYKKLTKAEHSNKKIPNEELEYMRLEISIWDFSRILFTCCIISFSLYYCLADKYGNNLLIKTGILLPFWLCLTGMIARCYYFFYSISRKWKYNKFLNEKQKSIFWLIIPFMTVLIYLFYNFELSIMITAILIGKFIWLDFIIAPKKIKYNIIQYVKTNKIILKIALEFVLTSLICGIVFWILKNFIFYNKYIIQ